MATDLMNARAAGRVAAGLAVLAVFGNNVRAAVIIHDNSSREFVWNIGVHYTDHTESPGNFLDITLPPSQSGERRPGTFSYWLRPSGTSSGPGWLYMQGEPGAETAKTTDWVVIHWNNESFLQMPTREYFPGEYVAQPDNWIGATIYYYLLPLSFSLAGGTPAISEAAYVGVRTRIGDHWHYGWILFTDYQWPVMWAYETLPDTPIQIPIPAPGVAPALLLAGSLAIARRRRMG